MLSIEVFPPLKVIIPGNYFSFSLVTLQEDKER
jgi:hypothetical protein